MTWPEKRDTAVSVDCLGLRTPLAVFVAASCCRAPRLIQTILSGKNERKIEHGEESEAAASSPCLPTKDSKREYAYGSSS